MKLSQSAKSVLSYFRKSLMNSKEFNPNCRTAKILEALFDEDQSEEAISALFKELEEHYKAGINVTNDEIYLYSAFFDYGITIPVDAKRAFELYKEAADKGHIHAMRDLACALANGHGIEENIEEAKKLYEYLLTQNHAIAQSEVAYFYENEKGGLKEDKEKVFQLTLESAKNGYSEGQFQLGLCYKNGYFVKEDMKKAVECFKLAADQGHAKAELYLGDAYMGYVDRYNIDRYNPIKDPKKGFHYYELASGHGLAIAKTRLGDIYLNPHSFFDFGWNLDAYMQYTDTEKAIKYYQEAALLGDNNARYRLADLYERSKDLKDNFELSIENYCKASLIDKNTGKDIKQLDESVIQKIQAVKERIKHKRAWVLSKLRAYDLKELGEDAFCKRDISLSLIDDLVSGVKELRLRAYSTLKLLWREVDLFHAKKYYPENIRSRNALRTYTSMIQDEISYLIGMCQFYGVGTNINYKAALESFYKHRGTQTWSKKKVTYGLGKHEPGRLFYLNIEIEYLLFYQALSEYRALHKEKNEHPYNFRKFYENSLSSTGRCEKLNRMIENLYYLIKDSHDIFFHKVIEQIWLSRNGQAYQSFSELKEICEKNEKDAPNKWYLLGFYYGSGLGVKEDLEQARIWMEKAARLNCTPALYWLSDYHRRLATWDFSTEEARFADVNVKKSYEYLKKIEKLVQSWHDESTSETWKSMGKAESDEYAYDYVFGPLRELFSNYYHAVKEYNSHRALALLFTLADFGDAAANYDLGLILVRNLINPYSSYFNEISGIDIEKAVYHFMKATTTHHTKGLSYSIKPAAPFKKPRALLYTFRNRGEESEEEYKRCYDLMMRLCETAIKMRPDFHPALFTLASHHQFGGNDVTYDGSNRQFKIRDDKIDFDKAFDFYKRAAKYGNEKAQIFLCAYYHSIIPYSIHPGRMVAAIYHCLNYARHNLSKDTTFNSSEYSDDKPRKLKKDMKEKLALYLPSIVRQSHLISYLGGTQQFCNDLVCLVLDYAAFKNEKNDIDWEFDEMVRSDNWINYGCRDGKEEEENHSDDDSNDEEEPKSKKEKEKVNQKELDKVKNKDKSKDDSSIDDEPEIEQQKPVLLRQFLLHKPIVMELSIEEAEANPHQAVVCSFWNSIRQKN